MAACAGGVQMEDCPRRGLPVELPGEEFTGRVFADDDRDLDCPECGRPMQVVEVLPP